MEGQGKKPKKNYTRHLSLRGFLKRTPFQKSVSNSTEEPTDSESGTPGVLRRPGRSSVQEMPNSRNPRSSSEMRGKEGSGEEKEKVNNSRLAGHSSIGSASHKERNQSNVSLSEHSSPPPRRVLMDAGFSATEALSAAAAASSAAFALRDPTGSSLLAHRRTSTNSNASSNASSSSCLTTQYQQYSQQLEQLQKTSQRLDQQKIISSLEEYRSLLKVRATSGGAKFYLNYISSQLQKLEELQAQEAAAAREDLTGNNNSSISGESESNYEIVGPSTSPQADMAHNGGAGGATSPTSRFLSVSGGSQKQPGGLVHQRSNESHDSTNSFLSMTSMASTSSGAGGTVVAASSQEADITTTTNSSKLDGNGVPGENEGQSMWKKALTGLKEKRGSLFKKKKQQEQEIIEVDPVYHLLKCAANRQCCPICAGQKTGPILPGCKKGCTQSNHVCNVCKCSCHDPPLQNMISPKEPGNKRTLAK